MKKLILLLLLICLHTSYAQVDFDNYVTLLSKGEIPKDFTVQTYDKVKGDVKEREELSGSKERIFIEGTNYAIDEILHSGLVVYGDQVTKYIEKIADRLLRGEPETRDKLRFYTLKSNAANAFSTDQGIVFVTTGLIAQLTSEAQLAYVLSHEISHFTEKHVLESFDLATSREMRNYDRISKMSQHSKDNELEADKLGIERYHKAGYDETEIINVFDVLMYSYLPFDEVPFPKAYLNTTSFYVTEDLFPNKVYPIKAEEDYDDENNSHPNIKKRKEAALAVIGEKIDWGKIKYHLGEEEFKLVRNICRFESVRCDILEENFGDGLYSIFLLEREFPNSHYLKRMKGQIWLNLLLYKTENLSAKAIDKTSELEGESAALHFFLKKLNQEGMTSVALRQIHDLAKVDTTDLELKTIYNRLIEHLATNGKFKLENFSKKTFAEAEKEFKELKPDTVTAVKESGTTKYDKIKNKRNSDLAQNFDSSRYYIYGMNDVLSDPLFSTKYKEFKSEHDKAEKEKEAYASMSRREKNAYNDEKNNDRFSIGMNEVIVVEPMVISYRRGVPDPIRSEKLEEVLAASIQDAASLANVETHFIDSRSLQSKGTQGYNERSLLTTLLEQLAAEEEIKTFPVDFQLLKTIQNDFGTKRVMFTLVEHAYSPNISFTGAFSSILFYPALLVYIPVGLLTGSNTEVSVLILDLEEGNIENGINYYFKDAPKKLQLGAHFYDIFKKFSAN
ncbi:MAG: hypothetical protein RIT43_9 [Bacteroidota bacterium]